LPRRVQGEKRIKPADENFAGSKTMCVCVCVCVCVKE
jgi:hypothetical protein